MRIIDNIILIAVFQITSAPTPPSLQAAPRTFTFTPHPSAQTKSFLITEFSLGRKFGHYTQTGENRSESEGMVAWELGYMRNVSGRWAVGLAVFLNGDDWRTQFGLKPRARYWLGKQSCLDFAAGPILKTSGEDHLTHTGLSSHLGFCANNWLGMDVGLEYVRFDGTAFAPGGGSMIPVEGHRTSFSVAARIGGVPGTITGIAVPAIAAAILYIVFQNFDDF